MYSSSRRDSLSNLTFHAASLFIASVTLFLQRSLWLIPSRSRPSLTAAQASHPAVSPYFSRAEVRMYIRRKGVAGPLPWQGEEDLPFQRALWPNFQVAGRLLQHWHHLAQASTVFPYALGAPSCNAVRRAFRLTDCTARIFSRVPIIFSVL